MVKRQLNTVLTIILPFVFYCLLYYNFHVVVNIP